MTYNVKQIAEMLGTNPETVRRWIRDGKLTAVQASRRAGNVVTEKELQRFVNATPKYAALGLGLLPFAPAFSVGLIAGVMAAYLKASSQKNEHVSQDGFKEFLENRISDLEEERRQKVLLLRETQSEINDISSKIEQYKNCLCNDEMIASALQSSGTDKEE